jgi:hypothetical protein
VGQPPDLDACQGRGIRNFFLLYFAFPVLLKGAYKETDGHSRSIVTSVLCCTNVRSYSQFPYLVVVFWWSTKLISKQHLAATGPNLDILRVFLSEGASVHLRNREGHTPLFLAASAGLKEHIGLLRDAGAHLHADEMKLAQLQKQSSANEECWTLAGSAE